MLTCPEGDMRSMLADEAPPRTIRSPGCRRRRPSVGVALYPAQRGRGGGVAPRLFSFVQEMM